MVPAPATMLRRLRSRPAGEDDGRDGAGCLCPLRQRWRTRQIPRAPSGWLQRSRSIMGSLRAPCRVEKVSFGTCGVGGHHDSYRINWRRRHRPRAPSWSGDRYQWWPGERGHGWHASLIRRRPRRRWRPGRQRRRSPHRWRAGDLSLADDCDLDFNYWASVGDQAGGASGPSGRRLVLGCPWGH